MPEEKTVERAKAALREGKRPTTVEVLSLRRHRKDTGRATSCCSWRSSRS